MLIFWVKKCACAIFYAFSKSDYSIISEQDIDKLMGKLPVVGLPDKDEENNEGYLTENNSTTYHQLRLWTDELHLFTLSHIIFHIVILLRS